MCRSPRTSSSPRDALGALNLDPVAIAPEISGVEHRLAPERVWERFAEERGLLRPEPAVAFEARRVQPVSVSRSALVRVEGA